MQYNTNISICKVDFDYSTHTDITFVSLSVNGRLYDPVIARVLSPDNYVQNPYNPQNYNRYSYCYNNPLVYVDPSGEIVVTSMIVGAVIFGYMGGMAANDWNANALDAGIGAGLIIGAAGGAAYATMGKAIAGTSFFGTMQGGGLAAAYSLSGAVSGGAAGYLTGFSGGLIASGNLNYAHQSGKFGAILGSATGATLGGIHGGWLEYGDEIKSWYNSLKPEVYYAPINPNYGNESGECAFRVFEEYSSSYGMEQYDFNYWIGLNNGELGLHPNNVVSFVNQSNEFMSNPLPTDVNAFRNAFINNERIMIGWRGVDDYGNSYSHLLMADRLIIRKSGKWKLELVETSQIPMAPSVVNHRTVGYTRWRFWNFIKNN